MIRCLAFDFAQKTDEEIPLAAVQAAMAAGRFVWIDAVLPSSPAEARETIARDLAAVLDLSVECRGLLRKSKPDTGYELLPGALLMSMAACSLEKHHIEAKRVDALVTERYLLTLARGRVGFLDEIHKHYRDDFIRFAHTYGFLLFELWDHLTRSYERIEQQLEDEVEQLQSQLAGRPDASVFPAASRLAANLVRLRRHVAPARTVLHEISTRKYAAVPASTQPFLQSTAMELDRVLTDLTVSREILTDAVNLSMSYVAFRTNRIVNRLTTVSFIFLPLTFLVGVYGMNFEHQPEYQWIWGYAWFWMLAALVTACALLVIGWSRNRERTPSKPRGAVSDSSSLGDL
jgi:magnesium transporter